jgi:flagellar basal body-associated protein FliL
MSFPPPSQPPNELPPGQGGGFGPPQGFGPPPSPYRPVPPRRAGGGPKVAVIAVGAVVVIAAIVGGAALVLSGGSDSKNGKSADAKAADSATASPVQASGSGAGTDSPSASASESVNPYVVLKPGECFDTPGLDSSITKTVRRSCSSPHDGEVIANETIVGTFTTEKALRAKVLELCKTDVAKKGSKVPSDAQYYYYAIYPSLVTYEKNKRDIVSCSLTLSEKPDGKKLTKPLP